MVLVILWWMFQGKPLGRSPLLIAQWNYGHQSLRVGQSVEDDGWSVRPKDATADENVKVVHTLVMCDRRWDLRSIDSVVVLCWSLFWYALLYVLYSFAIILARKREPVTFALIVFRTSSYCKCSVAFLMVPWVGLQCVIVLFSCSYSLTSFSTLW